MNSEKIDVSMLGITAYIEVKSIRRSFNRPHLGLWVDGEWYGWYYKRQHIDSELKQIIYAHWLKRQKLPTAC